MRHLREAIAFGSAALLITVVVAVMGGCASVPPPAPRPCWITNPPCRAEGGRYHAFVGVGPFMDSEMLARNQAVYNGMEGAIAALNMDMYLELQQTLRAAGATDEVITGHMVSHSELEGVVLWAATEFSKDEYFSEESQLREGTGPGARAFKFYVLLRLPKDVFESKRGGAVEIQVERLHEDISQEDDDMRRAQLESVVARLDEMLR